jgi:hypothetical protein
MPCQHSDLGKLLAIFGGDLALLWPKIALVTYDDDGNGFGTLCVSFKARVLARVPLCVGHGWSLREEMEGGHRLDD